MIAKLLLCPCCGGMALRTFGHKFRQLCQSWATEEETTYLPAKVVCKICGLSIAREECLANHLDDNSASRAAAEKVTEAWNQRM